MSKKLNAMKASIGGKETTPGTAVARTARIPLGGFTDLARKPEKVDSGLIAGENITSGKRTVAYGSQGSIPFIPMACAGMGKLLTALLGAATTPVEIGAVVRIRYIGSEASGKLTLSGTDLTSEVGDRDSEAGDANFGTSGVLDLTDAATDTAAELVSVVDAYSDYDAELVTGAGSVDLASGVAMVYESLNNWCYLFFGAAGTSLYLHRWDVDLTAAERDSMSIQIDGGHDDYLYDGAYVDTMSLSAAKKSEVSGSFGIVAMGRTGGQTETALDLPDNRTMMFHKGNTMINGVDLETLLKDASIEISNNMDADGYSQGLERLFVEKGMFSMGGSMSLRYNANVYGLLTVAENDTVIPVAIQFKGKEISDSIDELLLFTAPYCQVDDYSEANDGANIDATVQWSATSPKGTQHQTAPIQVFMITADSAAY
jgi:hypothetical protein